MIQFTLYSRSYCHLCEDMLEQLRAALGSIAHTIEVIDIDVEGREDFFQKYDEVVPVLVAQRQNEVAEQLCHYYLNLPALHSFLNESHQTSQS